MNNLDNFPLEKILTNIGIEYTKTQIEGIPSLEFEFKGIEICTVYRNAEGNIVTIKKWSELKNFLLSL